MIDEQAITAGNTVSCKFTMTGPLVWVGEAKCKHGVTTNATYLIAPGVPPIDHALMVNATRAQHDAVIHCDCPYDDPKLSATVTCLPTSAVPPGQQRYIPQSGASIQPPAKDFFFGPGLTCAVAGAYQIQAKIQLSRSTTQGATGLGVLVLTGAPVLNVPMVDESARATANINAMLNLGVNQSVAIGYENTSAQAQDVQLATLMVSEVWVP